MSGIIDTVGSKSGIVGSDVYPAGHIIKVTHHSSLVGVVQNGNGTAVEGDGTDCHVTCTAGNKLHIWIIGGNCLSYTGTGSFFYGLRINDNSVNTDVWTSYLYSRVNADYRNDSIGSVMWTHTAVTSAVIIKRALIGDSSTYHAWEADDSQDAPVAYKVMEEQV